MRKSLEKCLKWMFYLPIWLFLDATIWKIQTYHFFLSFLSYLKNSRKTRKTFHRNWIDFWPTKKKLFLPSSFFNWNLAQSNFIKLWIFTVTCTMLSLILGVMSLISTFELKFHHKIRSYFTAHCPQYTFQVIMIFWNYIIII